MRYQMRIFVHLTHHISRLGGRKRQTSLPEWRFHRSTTGRIQLDLQPAAVLLYHPQSQVHKVLMTSGDR